MFPCDCDCHNPSAILHTEHCVPCCDGTNIDRSGHGDPWWLEDETMVDLGGGMVVPLSELLED